MQEIYVGIDIGTKSTRAVIAEERLGGEIVILGIGEAPSEGVSRGNIVNIERAQKPMAKAVADAEKMADIEVREAFLAVGGDRLRTFSSRGVTAIPKDQESINSTNVSEVLQAAKAVVIPSEASIIDSVVREFVIDGQGGITDPVGMTGVRMEADVGLLMAPKSTLGNLERAAERAGIMPAGQAATIRGVGRAVLTEDEAEIGAAIIDMGGGTTEIGVFRRGTLVWAYSFGYAGESITKDMTVGLSLPFETAEELKLEFGSALAENVPQEDMVSIPGIGGREPRAVERCFLAHIIEPRVEEILILCKDAVLDAELGGKLAAGVILTGGSSRLDDIVPLTEKVFDLPVRTGAPRAPGEVPDLARSPEFAGAVGAVYAASERRHRADYVEEDEGLWSKIRNWFVRKV